MMKNNTKILCYETKKMLRTPCCMVKKYEKMKIRVEHFQNSVKIERTVGKRPKKMFFPENEITLKMSCS